MASLPTRRDRPPARVAALVLVLPVGCATSVERPAGPAEAVVAPPRVAPSSAAAYLHAVPPQPEPAPAALGPGEVWRPGHWRWEGGRYRWVPGRREPARVPWERFDPPVRHPPPRRGNGARP